MTRSSTRLGAFWILQLVGWSAYAVALMIPWLGRYPLSVMWSNKLVIAGTGLATSSVLRLVYRRVARERAGPLTLGVAAILASVAGAFVWNGVASTILGRSLQNDSVLLGALGRTLPRFDGVLYHALVLLTWSLLYLGARHYRALVAERERSLQSRVAGARSAAARASVSDRPALPVQRAERHLDTRRDRSKSRRDRDDRAIGRPAPRVALATGGWSHRARRRARDRARVPRDRARTIRRSSPCRRSTPTLARSTHRCPR